MPLIAAGISFRTAPLEVRERVALADPQIRPLLRFLIGHGGLSGVVLLSTCNRTELYASLPTEARTDEVVSRLCRSLDPTGGSALAEHIAVFLDEDAALHLFQVAAGLESMVVGEAQVLGQVRAAHRLALEAGSVDAPLDFLFQDLAAAAVDSDLVITSTSSSAPVLDVATVAAVQRRRGGRQLCIVDIAVPRDVEPAVATLPGVVLVDIDEVGRQLDATVPTAAGRRRRRPRAWCERKPGGRWRPSISATPRTPPSEP